MSRSAHHVCNRSVIIGYRNGYVKQKAMSNKISYLLPDLRNKMDETFFLKRSPCNDFVVKQRDPKTGIEIVRGVEAHHGSWV
jgi:hypothetical protein